MRRLPLLTIWLCFSLLAPGFSGPLSLPALTQSIFADALGSGWSNWSWATVDLQATSPVHSGSRSIAVTCAAWQGLYLHKAGVDIQGLTDLRFFLNGGAAGGQRLNVYLNLQVNGGDQIGPAFAVTPPAANAWEEIRVPLSTLNPGGATVTGITWQCSTDSSQPTYTIDDISLVSPESPEGPQLSGGALFPRSVPADGFTPLVVRATITDPQGAGDIAAVTLDAARLGRETVTLRDDGRSNDGQPGDGVYGAALTIAPGTAAGEQKLLLTAKDQAGHSASLPLGTLAVLDTPGGSIPPVLPQHIGWGSNAWSENAGQDWQVNSGVPWNYVYQYITYNWETWGSNFVSRFVHQAWGKNYVPMVTVYMILGVPPNCGESSTCYAQKLQNAGTVREYLDSLARAAREAKGSQPVIFNLEPDFYGYMQQLSNSAGRPAGVRANDPSSYPVALNIAGYPNTLAGFGGYLVDLIHNTAPNALVAPMASMWAVNGDPQSVTDVQAIDMGRSTARFIAAMGGDRADALVVEWSDRDAGFGLRPWWDDTDRETPRPTRAILWENALSHTVQKRLFLWQVPVGNMSQNDTCNHYRDNRVAYAFSHPRDLMDAGVIGVLFGGGMDCMTGVTTDGGFVAAQGAVAYSAPAAPGGLTVGLPQGVIVPLRWDESSEPDLWGYRLIAQPVSGGTPFMQDSGRRNSTGLLIPRAGDWTVGVAAYDAMGNQSELSAPVTITTTEDAIQFFLPLVRR
ncbi:MAG: hypothetical protein PHQ40_09130 [Anaerolineaceae bacterium]|nr:hypothetical protein [Anaerolineaceae bacterium]